jgi:hypothetical protein
MNAALRRICTIDDGRTVMLTFMECATSVLPRAGTATKESRSLPR